MTAVFLCLAIPGPTSATTAAPPTCHGKAATIVGGPGRLSGTEGDDVIVTAGSRLVEALGGNDTICVTGDGRGQYVDAGPGDDLVDVGALGTGTTDLGAGSDTFVGSPWGDTVYADGYYGRASDHDHISTKGGGDQVRTGVRGQPGDDDIALGAGPDSVVVIGTSTGTVTGGGGVNRIEWRGEETPGAWVFDNRHGTITRDGAVVSRMADFSRFDLRPLETQDVTFLGSALGEQVRLTLFVVFDQDRTFGHVVARMGAGDDGISVRGAQSPSLFGGPGRDRISYSGQLDGGEPLTMDLRLGTVVVGEMTTARAHSFEDAAIGFAAPHSSLIGTAGANRLGLTGCRVTIVGLAGDDSLDLLGRSPGCGGAAYGGPGNDRLLGSLHPDRLYGGSGRDVANGREGNDVCRAETERSCEA